MGEEKYFNPDEIINLKEVFFGCSDGKNEAKQEIFLDTFFDNNDIYSKLLKGRYLILGSKGAGKTLLVEYFRKKRFFEGDLFIDIRLEDFLKKKNELKKEKKFYDPESLLKWVIYIELSKCLLGNECIQENKYINQIKKFVKKNKFDLKLDTNKILEHIEENGIEGNVGIIATFISKFKATKKNRQKMTIGDYYQYISELEFTVKNALKESYFKNCIYIVFDELDEIAKKSNNSMSVLSKLVDLFHLLNTRWEEENIPIRLIVSIRKDVYFKLDSVSSGKIYEDYGLVLDWGKQMDKNSALFRLIYHKIRNSNEKYKQLTDSEIRDRIFSTKSVPIHRKQINIERYILTKTFFRPRDIITFFNKLKERVSENQKIDSELLTSVLTDYSYYLLMEIGNEASVSLKREEFNDMIELLKNMRKTIFSYEQIQKHFKENKTNYPKIGYRDFEEILKVFFELSVIGNCKKINEGKRGRIYFKFTEDYQMNKNENFSIHYGIRPALGLSLE